MSETEEDHPRADDAETEIHDCFQKLEVKEELRDHKEQV